MASSTNGIIQYAENPEYYEHYWEQRTLFTTLDNASIRAIFTTVFVVLNFLIVVAATFLLKKRNLYRLRRKDESVPMNYLTSWMSLTEAISYAWDTCQLPGGIYGLLMFATGGFGLAHQYFVNLFILPVILQAYCTFDYGVVTTHNASTVPASTFSAASTVYDAQYRALLNDGAWGIYDKVNYTTSTTFSPTLQDVIGWWSCSYQNDTTIAWNEWQTLRLVESFLKNQSFVFPGLYDIANADNPVDKSIQGFLAWNAEQLDNSTIPWSVRASMAYNLNGSAAPSDSTAAVTNLECLLVAQAGCILPGVNISSGLSGWTDKTFGFLMSDPSSFYAVGIEWMLNAMVMVSGSGNVDTRTLPARPRPTFGCIVQGTKIMSQIWVILSVMFLVLVLVVLADIYLLLSLRFDGERNANLVEAAPSSVQNWQLALLRDVTGNDTITTKQMRDYAYGRYMDRYGWIKIRAKSWGVAMDCLHTSNRVLGSHCQIENEMPSTIAGRAKRKAREIIEAAINRMKFAAPDRRSPDTQELGGSTHQESGEQINGTPTKQNNSEDVVPLQEATAAQRIPEP